jgi:GST-like protein
MFDLYFHKSPNTVKIAILFEAAGLKYNTHFVTVGSGEQFNPEFVAISPNSKVPVIRDHAPADGGPPVIVFESNAILLYLAEKTGLLLPREFRERCEMMQWLFWQAACQGPFCGQSAHFTVFRPDVEYGRERYGREARRLFKVLDDRLAGREFIMGENYTIADIACYPWTTDKARTCIGLEDMEGLSNVQRWSDMMAARSEVIAGYRRLEEDEGVTPSLVEFAANMFGLRPDDAKAAAASSSIIMTGTGMQFSSLE